MPLQRAVGAPQHLRTSLNLPRLQEEEGADRMGAGGGAVEGNLPAVPNRSLQENPTSKAVRRRREQARNEAMGVSALALPAVLGAAGCTTAGITAGSLGAKMLSAAAIANGGGVVAGSQVATLQSLGCGAPPPEEDFTGSRRSKQLLSGTIIGVAVGLGVSALALPAVLGAAGCTTAGIAAGSLGAKMLSAAAIANGGGVVAGSQVATLQSLGTIIGAAAGLGVSAVALPAVLGAAGFTAAGIAAGSLGAKMMSAAAIANGGGVAAGSLVATLQSLGAAGAPVAVKAATAGVGAALGALVGLL